MPFFKRPKWTNLYLFMHNELAQRANNLSRINLNATNSDLVVSKWRFHSLTEKLEDSPSFSELFCFPSELPAMERWQIEHLSHFSPLQALPDGTRYSWTLWTQSFRQQSVAAPLELYTVKLDLASTHTNSLLPLCKICIFGAKQE